jgi:hypothetical protein
VERDGIGVRVEGGDGEEENDAAREAPIPGASKGREKNVPQQVGILSKSKANPSTRVKGENAKKRKTKNAIDDIFAGF